MGQVYWTKNSPSQKYFCLDSEAKSLLLALLCATVTLHSFAPPQLCDDLSEGLTNHNTSESDVIMVEKYGQVEVYMKDTGRMTELMDEEKGRLRH